MSYAAHHKGSGALVEALPKHEVPNKPGILRRIFEEFVHSQQIHVDRQRLFTSDWSANAGAFNYREVTMPTRLEMAVPEAFIDCETRRGEWIKLADAIGSRWTALRCAWMRRSARRRLRRSIAHLDERLLADIGLNAEDLGLTERLARRRAVSLEKVLVC